MQILRKLLTDNEIDLRMRVAFTLLLLYGQPLSRIVRLTIEDVIISDDGVSIRFGKPPTPVPVPFADMVLDLIDQRTNMRTATNPNSLWLFPGRRASQPLRPEIPRPAVRRERRPHHHRPGLRPAPTGPASIIADALGIHYTTPHRHHDYVGGTWNRYASSDHSR
ncbi:hypothetical protein [Nocardia sp. NPDC004750]